MIIMINLRTIFYGTQVFMICCDILAFSNSFILINTNKHQQYINTNIH